MASVVIEESTFDPDAFGQSISSAFDFNTVGYAYAINHGGNAVVSEGTGGLYGHDEGRARTSADGPETAFETDTRIDVNSVSKIITTVAVLHRLESEYGDLDAMLSTPISEFLPSDWTIGPNVEFITVRHLLTHTSGFAEGGPGDSVNAIGVNFQSFGNNTFQNLRDLVAANPGIPTRTLPDGSLAYTRSYSNANFSLLAKMIPYMTPDADVRGLLDDISLNSPESADAQFGFFYSQYVKDNILTPSGIDNATMFPTGENPALGYVFADVVDDVESAPGIAQKDYTDVGGAFGWKLSAPELALFMNALRQTNTLLSDNARDLMNSVDFLLGWAPNSISGTNPYVLSPLQNAFGTIYTHGGAGRGLRTEIVMFPGDIDVALAMNSFQSDDAFPEGIGNRFEFLRFAYSTAWTDLVIEGDINNNSFILRLNSLDPNLLDLVVDDVQLMSFRIDVLRSLELRGLGGNDSFEIEDLPASIDLILDGGADNDTFTIGHSSGSTFDYIYGNLTILGGGGNQDEVEVNDANGLSDEYSIKGIDNAELAVQGRIDASDYPLGKMFLYNQIEDLVLRANIDPNQIELSGIDSGMTVTIFAGFNPDTLLVHDIGSDVTVNLYGGADGDTFNVWDVEAGATINVFGDVLALPGGNDTLTLGNGNVGTIKGSVFFEGAGGADLLILDDSDAPAPAGRGYLFITGSVSANDFGDVTYSNLVEQVRLEGSIGNDAINVESLGANTDLELYGHDGNDIFMIAGVSQDVDPVLGDVVIHGGDGYPPSHVPNQAFPEDDDRVYVFDDKNDMAGSFTINLNQGNVLVGRLTKLGGNPSDMPPNVIYDQIERTELHTGAGANTISVVAAPRFNQVSVYAGPGNDQIDVESTPLSAAAMQIFGEGGTDTIRVSPVAQTLGNLRSLLSVDGGSGVAAELDNLSVHDTLSGNAAPYELGSSSLTRAGSAGIDFAKIENLMVSLSAAANSMNISATAAGTSVTIHGNAGNDTLTAGNLASSVTFVGGAGLNDRAFLAGTNGNDTISVTGDIMTLGAGSLTSLAEYSEIDGLGGMDIFHVGNGDVDSIGVEPVLRGGDGNDSLIINDQDDLGNDIYTVTASQVSKPNFLLVYHDMESLNLNAGTGNNTININSSSSGTQIVINAGAGGDTIHLSPTSQNLSFINGPVIVNGQQGVDNVILHEELFALGGLFPLNITRSTVSRNFFGGLNFDTIERLRVNLGSGNNKVNVTEFNRDVLFALYGNVGADTFNVTVHPTLQDTGGRLFIDGGGNVDRLNVTYASKPEVSAKPKVHHKKTAQTAGTITVDYPEALYDIEYLGVEDVEIDKA